MKMEPTQAIAKPVCGLCKREMNFAEGDVIFGKKWYHRDCAHLYKFRRLILH